MFTANVYNSTLCARVSLPVAYNDGRLQALATQQS